jgi:hypothetical protein
VVRILICGGCATLNNGTRLNPISTVFTVSRSMWDCVFVERVLWLCVVLVSSRYCPWPWSVAIHTALVYGGWWRIQPLDRRDNVGPGSGVEDACRATLYNDP